MKNIVMLFLILSGLSLSAQARELVGAELHKIKRALFLGLQNSNFIPIKCSHDGYSKAVDIILSQDTTGKILEDGSQPLLYFRTDALYGYPTLLTITTDPTHNKIIAFEISQKTTVTVNYGTLINPSLRDEPKWQVLGGCALE